MTFSIKYNEGVSSMNNQHHIETKLCIHSHEESLYCQYKGNNIMEFRCSKNGCERKQWENGVYCLMHSCVIDKCLNKRMIGGVSCLEHKCIEKGCLRSQTYESVHCTKHACIEAKCNGLKIQGTQRCTDHTCKSENCDRSAEHGYCVSHRCRMSGCWSARLNDCKIRYCVAHACAVNDCPLPADPISVKGWYCAEHKTQYSLEKPDECAVCLEAIGADEVPWSCGHYIHRECITRSLKAACPICRTSLLLTSDEMDEINSRNNQSDDELHGEFQYSSEDPVAVQSITVIAGPMLVWDRYPPRASYSM